MILHKIKGHNSSGLLFIFWFLLSFMSMFQLFHVVRNIGQENIVNDMNISQIYFFNYVVYYTLISLLTILNCFADKPPNHSDYPKTLSPCPELTASFTNKIHFFWFSKTCYLGFMRPLTEKDLFDIRPQDTCAETFPKFEKQFTKSVKKNQK